MLCLTKKQAPYLELSVDLRWNFFNLIIIKQIYIIYRVIANKTHTTDVKK